MHYFQPNTIQLSRMNGWDKVETRSHVLTWEIVKHNFWYGGPWYLKEYISANDLEEYQFISYDAFDYINHPLTYVELPNNTIFVKQGKKNKYYRSVYAIKWRQVLAIKVKDENEDLLINANLLITRYRSQHLDHDITQIITIADRTFKHVLFINEDYFEYEDYFLYISADFYDAEIFRNIISIKIDFQSLMRWTLVRFGKRSFLNCDKLDGEIRINTCNVYIGKAAFAFTKLNSFVIKDHRYLFMSLLLQRQKDVAGVIVQSYAFCESSLFRFNINLKSTLLNRPEQILIFKNAFINSKIRSFSIKASKCDISTESIFNDCYHLRYVFIDGNFLKLTKLYDINDFHYVWIVIIGNSFKQDDVDGLFGSWYTGLQIKFLINEVDYDLINDNLFANIGAEHFRLVTNLEDSFVDESGLTELQIDDVEYVDDIDAYIHPLWNTQQ